MDNKNILFFGKEDYKAYKSIFTLWAFLSICTVGALLPIALIYIISTYLKIKTTTYRITTDKVQIEFGILSKTITTLELWRVNDLQYQQSFIQRIFGECNIILLTQDKTHPLLILKGFTAHNGKNLFYKIEEAISTSRKNHGVVGLVA